jgi:hypothetical protein
VNRERHTFRKDKVEGNKDEIDGHQVVLENQLAPATRNGKPGRV